MTALKVVSASQEYDLNRRRDKSWWLAFGFIVLLSFTTRFFKVSEPDHVCWDETHFGKMGSWYINRTFFFDVHPPLGKMLIAASGYFSGYDGSFPFEKPGDKYENTNYLGMRMFCAFLGACIAPFSYLIVWELTGSLNSAILASSLVICDVGVLTLTQYILLDPILLFFIMASTFGMVKFHNYHLNPFSSFWWFWLCLTGSMLSCAVGTKFVGVFVVLLCGLFTINELWDILGDLKKSIFYFWKHFAARAFGLILLPVSIYVFFFYIHLTVLHKSGNGDGFFSSAFQAQLKGNSLHNASMPKDVAYGAIVTLKNKRTGGGYLHSHFHLYPEGVGARQQQITTYTHKDDNNKFLIKPFDREPEEGKIEFVKHGDLIRLEHVTTNRNLHSHREPAPIMKKHFQVTGYGENGVGDPNDIWKVQIISGGSNGVLTAVTTKIKLIHYLTLCVLTTTGKQLPQWAYEQQEVTCNPNLRDPYAIWNIEENIFDLLPNVNFEVYASNFFERFFESHAVMLQGNAGLKPKEGEVTSRPYQWPINYRGQFFSGNGYRIYLLGNPIIWWSNILFLFIFVNLFAFNAILQQRGYGLVLLTPESDLVVLKSSLWLFIGWALHYIPFYAMGRVLYFHHYFPALLFSTMLSGVIINYLIEIVGTKIFSLSFKNHFTRSLLLLILATSFYSFFIFSPLAYGMSGPYAGEVNSTMHGLKWLESWEF